MNIWLKPIELADGQEFFDCLKELATYKDAYARPVPEDFELEEFDSFKSMRIKMATGIDLKPGIPRTNTYWVMDDSLPVGYATLHHEVDPNKPGGHFGCCLIKDYQNKGLGNKVADLLSDIAYKELGIEEVIYTAKDANEQSQRSIAHIGGELIGIHDGYHFYKVNIKKKIEERGLKV